MQTTCSRNHIYDSDQYASCPYCNRGTRAIFFDVGGNGNTTMPGGRNTNQRTVAPGGQDGCQRTVAPGAERDGIVTVIYALLERAHGCICKQCGRSIRRRYTYRGGNADKVCRLASVEPLFPLAVKSCREPSLNARDLYYPVIAQKAAYLTEYKRHRIGRKATAPFTVEGLYRLYKTYSAALYNVAHIRSTLSEACRNFINQRCVQPYELLTRLGIPRPISFDELGVFIITHLFVLYLCHFSSLQTRA